MINLEKYKGFAFFLLFLFINLTNCELQSPENETKVDYTGQRGIIIDIDSNTYQTVGIGSQIWMAENLATEHLNNGDLIPQINNDSIWASPWNKQSGNCTYDNDSIYYKKSFGLLYNYYAVKTGALCPDGWHVPSKADWNTLFKFAGGSKIAGGKLKNMYSSLWEGTNYGFQETYDFNALPGGYRQFISGKFFDIGTGAYWWTADSVSYFQAYSVSIQNSNTNIGIQVSSNRYGFNIRCIKNK